MPSIIQSSCNITTHYSQEPYGFEYRSYKGPCFTGEKSECGELQWRH